MYNRILNPARPAPPLVAVALMRVGVCASGSMLADYSVVERGPHHRTWEQLDTVVDEAGDAQEVASRYVELKTGMHFWDEEGQQWQEFRALIEQHPNGALAQYGPQRIIFANNLNTLGPTPQGGGQRLRATVLALAYYDTLSGQDAILGVVKDSVGQLVGPNQILYPDAFEDISADVLYIYEKSGLTQMVILREQPVPPEAFGLPSLTTRLEVLPEWFDAPIPQTRSFVAERKVEDPQLREKMAEPDFRDQEIDFGSVQLGLGRTFWSEGEWDNARPDDPDDFYKVGKRWSEVEGRTILFESVEYEQLTDSLSKLPRRWNRGASLNRKSNTNAVAKLSPSERTVPQHLYAQIHEKKPVLMAQAKIARSPGLVLDYTTVSSSSNYTFEADTTYYINNNTVIMSGTVAFEGGSVLKFGGTSGRLLIPTLVVCKTDAYRPLVLTAKDDDTVGQKISGSTGTPSGYYANYAFRYYSSSNPLELSYFHIRHAKYAMVLYYSPAKTLRHCQWVNCETAIHANYSSPPVKIYNGLMDDLGSRAFNVYGGASFVAQHFTLHDSPNLANLSSGSVTLTNSLLVDVDTIQTYSGSDNYEDDNWSDVFQTLGAGEFYLKSGSTYRNAGNSNIEITLASDLKSLTTYPPVELTSDFTTDTVLQPQAPRDGDDPDIGYHYLPLDYVWGGLNLINATLTLNKGVAVGMTGAKGTTLQQGANFVSEGTATALNRLTRFATVQEQSVASGADWYSSSTSRSLMDTKTTTTSTAQVHLRFTDAVVSSFGGHLIGGICSYIVDPLEIEHSQLRGPRIDYWTYVNLSGLNVSLKNSLIENCDLDWYQPNYSGYYTFTLDFYNNLFVGGDQLFDLSKSGTTWTIKDNLFDTDTLTNNSSRSLSASHNGYRGGLSSLGGSGNKTGLTMDYQPGPAADWFGVDGRYYYPTIGGNLSSLIDAGSRSRTAAGLYHFTVKTAQESTEGADTSSTVGIGCHWVGVGTDDLPLDTDGDSLPDYLEDRDGDDVVDSNETDWEDSENGTTGVPGLVVFTILE